MPHELERIERISEIQSAIGKALWQIQAFEDTLAHLIAIVFKIPPRTSLEQAEAILDNVRSNTLGRLIKETKKAVEFDDSFEVFMLKFLEERNWLVHKSRRTHTEFLDKKQVFIDLRYRINRLADDAKEFNEFFAGVIKSWVQGRGISETKLQELYREFTDVWR